MKHPQSWYVSHAAKIQSQVKDYAIVWAIQFGIQAEIWNCDVKFTFWYRRHKYQSNKSLSMTKFLQGNEAKIIKEAFATHARVNVFPMPYYSKTEQKLKWGEYKQPNMQLEIPDTMVGKILEIQN